MNYLIKFSLALIFLTGISACRTNAQTVDLSTKEGVIKELGKQKNEDLSKANICIEQMKESAKIIVIGFFRNDYGCHFEGAFIDSRYFEETDADLSKNALAALGWKTANQTQREQLAKLWVDKGLLAFSTVLYTKDKDFIAIVFSAAKRRFKRQRRNSRYAVDKFCEKEKRVPTGRNQICERR